MAEISWGHGPSNAFETGVSKGVLYPQNSPGVAWSGLIAVNETPTDAAFRSVYQDGIKVQNTVDLPNYSSTIDAFTYPDEFAELDGTAEVGNGLYVEEQVRREFGLSYQTLIGGATPLKQGHYKLHLVYNAVVLPTNRDYNTLDDTPEAMFFSWEIATTPVTIPGFRPSSHFIIDSRKMGFRQLKEFERVIYGSLDSDARMPSPSELVAIFQNQ